jgi:hypothetical protein
MEIIDETVGSPASSGQAPDTESDTRKDDTPSSDFDVWEPPAYLKLLGQAMGACGTVQAAAEAAQELRNLELTSIDSDASQILRAHIHALNAVFARLIAQSMDRPLKHAPLIGRALQAQQQCIETAEALRQIQECDLRRQKQVDNRTRDLESLRLLRIRMGFKSS